MMANKEKISSPDEIKWVNIPDEITKELERLVEFIGKRKQVFDEKTNKSVEESAKEN